MALAIAACDSTKNIVNIETWNEFHEGTDIVIRKNMEENILILLLSMHLCLKKDTSLRIFQEKNFSMRIASS